MKCKKKCESSDDICDGDIEEQGDSSLVCIACGSVYEESGVKLELEYKNSETRVGQNVGPYVPGLTSKQREARDLLKILAANSNAGSEKEALAVFYRMVTAHCRCDCECCGECPSDRKRNPLLKIRGSFFKGSYFALAGCCLYYVSKRSAITMREIINKLPDVNTKTFNKCFTTMYRIAKKLKIDNKEKRISEKTMSNAESFVSKAANSIFGDMNASQSQFIQTAKSLLELVHSNCIDAGKHPGPIAAAAVFLAAKAHHYSNHKTDLSIKYVASATKMTTPILKQRVREIKEVLVRLAETAGISDPCIETIEDHLLEVVEHKDILCGLGAGNSARLLSPSMKRRCYDRSDVGIDLRKRCLEEAQLQAQGVNILASIKSDCSDRSNEKETIRRMKILIESNMNPESILTADLDQLFATPDNNWNENDKVAIDLGGSLLSGSIHHFEQNTRLVAIVLDNPVMPECADCVRFTTRTKAEDGEIVDIQGSDSDWTCKIRAKNWRVFEEVGFDRIISYVNEVDKEKKVLEYDWAPKGCGVVVPMGSILKQDNGDIDVSEHIKPIQEVCGLSTENSTCYEKLWKDLKKTNGTVSESSVTELLRSAVNIKASELEFVWKKTLEHNKVTAAVVSKRAFFMCLKLVAQIQHGQYPSDDIEGLAAATPNPQFSFKSQTIME